MAYQQMPSFSNIKTSLFEVPKPGIGGLNLFDLEYEQEANQSPYMLNMMYRNGTFAKRYGQEVSSTYANAVYAYEYFDGKLIVHTGTQMLVDGVAVSGLTLPTETGLFIKFYKTLLYYCDGTIYEYKYHFDTTPHTWSWGIMEPHVPEVYTGIKPDGTGTPERSEDWNLLTKKYTFVYNGDNTANYVPVGERTDIIDWSADADNKHSKIIVKVEVDDEYVTKVEGTDYDVDATNKKIVFKSGHYPATGTDNVTITYTYKEDTFENNRARLMDSKYYSCYGANGTSHLFLAGGGDGYVFYSDSYDHTYFPEDNWIRLGSTEDDITGFGLQYNVLIVFKPKEIYSMYSYNVTASMVASDEEDSIGKEKFGSQIVNSQIGCDAPYSIQLVNNQLTWFNSREGVCTLVSTNIADERNVRVISRNINRTNNMGVTGILDIKASPTSIISVDYDYKYFLCFPKHNVYNETTQQYEEVDYGMCYVWDYGIAPFVYTASKATDPKTLDWFIFDNFYVKKFLQVDLELIYISNKTCKVYNQETQLLEDKYLVVKLGNDFSDLDLTDTRKYVGINAYYMTPFLQFDATSYLKTIKNLYVQCRGDTASKIDIYYYTDESEVPTQDNNQIIVGGRIWNKFEWNTFTWSIVNWATTFRRKCSLKKIQMAAFLFKNNEVYRDMSITNIALDFQVDKHIK